METDPHAPATQTTQTTQTTVPTVPTVPDGRTRARLLAAMLSRPLTGTELGRRSEEPGVPAAVASVLRTGSARRTADGGLALDDRRRSAALGALARDLGL
ncbi:hypothetical protein [Cellulomonas sp. Marseille-Q8402]